MSMDSDPIALLSRALDQTGAIISRVRPEQAALPTPCRSWDVRALVNHVVHDVQLFTIRTSGGDLQTRDDDVIGDDWTKSYDEAAAGLLEVWRRPGTIDRTIQLPFGERPASWSTTQQTADLAVHGWDIAKATGQPADLDPEIGQASLDWSRENLLPQFRGDEESGRSFGPEVPAPDDASLYDRLAAFFGRDPREWR